MVKTYDKILIWFPILGLLYPSIYKRVLFNRWLIVHPALNNANLSYHFLCLSTLLIILLKFNN